MNSIYVATKDVAAIVKATFPSYRRKKVCIRAAETVRFYGLNWDGGSKSEYRACSLDGRKSSYGPDMGLPAPWNNPYEGLEVEVPVGFCIVQGGHFCGKEATLWINVHPSDMPKYLTYRAVS